MSLLPNYNLIDLNLISYNVKGIQNLQKRDKIFEYLRNDMRPNGVIFLQETHSSAKDEKSGKMIFTVIYVLFRW